MPSHFHIRILSRERPSDASALIVSATLPRVDFIGERGAVRQSAIKALAVKDADFDFRHVQPTGVLWRVVKDDASQEFVGDADAEHLLEALAEMRVEVVEYQMDATCRRIDLFEQVLDKSDEVGLGTMIGNLHGPSSALGFDRHEQVAGTAPNVLIILPQGHSGPDRQRSPGILEQLLALLVQANDRFSRSERTGV